MSPQNKDPRRLAEGQEPTCWERGTLIYFLTESRLAWLQQSVDWPPLSPPCRHCGYSKAFQDSDEEKMHYQNGQGECSA